MFKVFQTQIYKVEGQNSKWAKVEPRFDHLIEFNIFNFFRNIKSFSTYNEIYNLKSHFKKDSNSSKLILAVHTEKSPEPVVKESSEENMTPYNSMTNHIKTDDIDSNPQNGFYFISSVRSLKWLLCRQLPKMFKINSWQRNSFKCLIKLNKFT